MSRDLYGRRVTDGRRISKRKELIVVCVCYIPVSVYLGVIIVGDLLNVW